MGVAIDIEAHWELVLFSTLFDTSDHEDDIKFSCVMYAWPIVRGYCIGQLQRPSGSICALVTQVNFC